MPPENEAQRRQFILEGQQHADFYLTPLADPAGKAVLVLGAGAGTDMLWALRQGAREVVGIDVLEQDPAALRATASSLGLDPGRVSFHCLDIVNAPRLGRRFDLVLSNNVFEHVADLPGAFAACAEVVDPGRGRVAIFSSPLYFSSNGSHLPTEPWEHLWADPEALHERLLAGGQLRPGHAIEVLSLADYMNREICLNRARLADYLEAIRRSGLTFLHLSALPDRCLSRLPRYLEAIRSRVDPAEVAMADLAVEGFAVELVLPPREASDSVPVQAVSAARLDEERRQNGTAMARFDAELRQYVADLASAREEAAALRRQIAEQTLETEALLARVQASWSFRIGRAVTAPARWLRSLR
jgi:SAM-dependent methyltransferase